MIRTALDDGEHRGELNETALFHRARPSGSERVLIVGLGDRPRFRPPLLAEYAGTATRFLGRRGIRDFTIAIPSHIEDVVTAASLIVEGSIVATLDTTLYRSKQDRPIEIDSLTVFGRAETEHVALEAGAKQGRILGEALNVARRLALTPANDMTPTDLATAAAQVAKQYDLDFEVVDEPQMHDLGMGALLGVSRGSSQPAKLIVLSYVGDATSNRRLVLIGKGLTFDSGGISLKPPENMHEMKYDMSGGASIIATMLAIGSLRPKLNIFGVVPASENLPGPDALKPGDILRAMNGKTIEVINTDAEGRLILADALCYATKELFATHIVDCATLTGAIVSALGHSASGAFTNDQAFLDDFLKAAEHSGERYWQLPIYDGSLEQMKSEIADLRNSGGRPAGALTAAAFLREFVDGTPWIHLDIAGTAYLDEEKSFRMKGPTGVPIRALVAFVMFLAANPL